MIAMRLCQPVKRRLTGQVMKGRRGVDQTPIKEYPSCGAIGRGAAIGNGEFDGSPREGGSVYPWECPAVDRQLLSDDAASWFFDRGVTPAAELHQER